MKICNDKRLKFKNKRKSETLTTNDIILYCETKDFLKSSYTNREIDKSDTFLLVFCSLSLEGTKGAEIKQLNYQHLWDLEKLLVLHICCDFALFRWANWGYTCKHNL